MKKIKELFYDYKLLLRNIPSIVVALFVLSVVLMNLMANKVVFRWNDICAADAGFILSWIPFLCMDVITKRFGPKAAIKVNIFAIILNILAVGIFAFITWIPGDGADYSSFNTVFGCTWFILFGSMFAMLISGIVNSVLNYIIGKLFKKNPNGKLAFISRSYISTFIAQFVDNFLFAFIVFTLIGPHYWDGFIPFTILICIGSGIFGALIELLCEVVFSPIGYRILKMWDKDNVGIDYLVYLKDKEKDNEDISNGNV